MCLIYNTIKKGRDIPYRIMKKELWYKVFTKHEDRFGGLFVQKEYMPEYEMDEKYHYRDGVPNYHNFGDHKSNIIANNDGYRKGFHLYTSLESAVRTISLQSSVDDSLDLAVALVEPEDIIAFGKANIQYDWHPETGVFKYMTIKKEIEMEAINDLIQLLRDFPRVEPRMRQVLPRRGSFNGSRKTSDNGKVPKPLGSHIL